MFIIVPFIHSNINFQTILMHKVKKAGPSEPFTGKRMKILTLITGQNRLQMLDHGGLESIEIQKKMPAFDTHIF